MEAGFKKEHACIQSIFEHLLPSPSQPFLPSIPSYSWTTSVSGLLDLLSTPSGFILI